MDACKELKVFSMKDDGMLVNRRGYNRSPALRIPDMSRWGCLSLRWFLLGSCILATRRAISAEKVQFSLWTKGVCSACSISWSYKFLFNLRFFLPRLVAYHLHQVVTLRNVMDAVEGVVSLEWITDDFSITVDGRNLSGKAGLMQPG